MWKALKQDCSYFKPLPNVEDGMAAIKLNDQWQPTVSRKLRSSGGAGCSTFMAFQGEEGRRDMT